MIRNRFWAASSLIIIAVAVVGIARSNDPKPIPDLIPAAFVDPERLPEPKPVPAPQPVVINPTTAVVLEWAGPTAIRTNKSNDFTLMVRNTAEQSAQRVIVQLRVPDGVTANDFAPEAKEEKGVFMWDLGTIAGKDVRDIRMKLSAKEKRDLTCQAWVTVTGTAGMSIAVREPKLEATISAPKEVVVGDKVTVKYTVKNVGDAEAAVPTATISTLTEGVTDLQTQLLGKTIGIGETLTGETIWTATKAGANSYTLAAEAEEGLKVTTATTVNVLAPKLTVAIAGPTERIVGRKATYTVTVMNQGDVPLNDVTVNETFPTAFRYVSSSCMNSVETGTVTWKVGSLPAGEKKVYTYEALAICPGPATHLVTAVGSRNTKAEASTKTVVDGVPAMRMEVVDLADPVEKGGETTYEIRLTNTGTKADSQLKLECHLPPELQFVSASGPTSYTQRMGIDFNGKNPQKQNTISFEPVAELAPKTEALFRVKVKAIAAGDVRFKASLTSVHLGTPVTKEESTRVYGD